MARSLTPPSMPGGQERPRRGFRQEFHDAYNGLGERYITSGIERPAHDPGRRPPLDDSEPDLTNVDLEALEHAIALVRGREAAFLRRWCRNLGGNESVRVRSIMHYTEANEMSFTLVATRPRGPR